MWPRPDSRSQVERQEALVDGTGFLVGLDPELPSEVRHGRVVRLQSGRPVAGQCRDPHQGPVRRFPQRIHPDEIAQQPHRAAVLAALLEVRDEAFGGFEMECVEPLTLRPDPVVIAGRQQRSAV
jgi:hypothetical protein